MKKMILFSLMIVYCIFIMDLNIYAVTDFEHDYNIMDLSNESILKYEINRERAYSKLKYKNITKVNKYGEDFLEIEEINPNKTIAKLNIKVEYIDDIWLNRRSKSDIFKVEILDNREVIKNKFKISFKNIYDLNNCSIYIDTGKATYPIKTYLKDGELYGFIHNKNLQKFDIYILENQYIDDIYEFRNEYYYNGLSFSLESGIVPITTIDKMKEYIKIEDFRHILNIGDYRGNISFKELYVILKNTFQEDFNVKYINRKLFQNNHMKMDFRSEENVDYGDFLYLIRELICLD